MSAPIAPANTGSRQLGRSFAAIAVAIVANVVLSLGIDQGLHVLGVYPPWGQPMFDASLNLLALSYRLAFGVLAGYLVARLAPRAPMRHAAILGMIAIALSTLGAIGSITQYDLGPDWYPIAIVVTAFPCIWVGAALRTRRWTRETLIGKVPA